MKVLVLCVVAVASLCAGSATASNFDYAPPPGPTALGLPEPACHGWYTHAKAPSQELLAQIAKDPAVTAVVGSTEGIPLPGVVVLDPCSPGPNGKTFPAPSARLGATQTLGEFVVLERRPDGQRLVRISLIDTYNMGGGGNALLAHELVHYYREVRRSYEESLDLASRLSKERDGYLPEEECPAYTAEYYYVAEHHLTNLLYSASFLQRRACLDAQEQVAANKK